MNKVFFDFGFKNNKKSNRLEAHVKFKGINFNNLNEDKKEIFWTLIVYICVALGMILRKTVIFNEPERGFQSEPLKLGFIIASFIISLAMLAPILRFINNKDNGRLNWKHPLIAFSIGFFSDMVFSLITDKFLTLFN